VVHLPQSVKKMARTEAARDAKLCTLARWLMRNYVASYADKFAHLGEFMRQYVRLYLAA
jgi:hypothetical protein